MVNEFVILADSSPRKMSTSEIQYILHDVFKLQSMYSVPCPQRRQNTRRTLLLPWRGHCNECKRDGRDVVITFTYLALPSLCDKVI